MTTARRPRVAAIGLDDAQSASIEPLCGELRQASTVSEYTENYSWSETDIMVATFLSDNFVSAHVNLFIIGPVTILWQDQYHDQFGMSRNHYLDALTNNTEREMAVTSECPSPYRPLAEELARRLSLSLQPPTTFKTSRPNQTTLISTTSSQSVVMRLALPDRQLTPEAQASQPIALILPQTLNLPAWFRAFLSDLHEVDKSTVPQPPPRLAKPSDWYTPEERDLVERILQIDNDVERLNQERDQRQNELTLAGQKADEGMRRALWADGHDLVDAVQEVLSSLGLKVRNMDEELGENDPKREDLRLTLENVVGWEAIVEVKGYVSGVRTNDSRQIREHRERYIKEEGRVPDLTLWLSNPHRRTDPSSRPAPDGNVEEAAAAVGAVHVQTTDLFQQWALVAAGEEDAATVIESLRNAEPGLWTPPVTN